MEIIKEENKVYILNNDHKEIAYVLFPNIDDKTVVIESTYVSETLRGMGIGSKLMEACYEVINKSEKKAVLKCSYAIAWYDKHKEYSDILK